MEYYVYFLRSLKDNGYYIGCTYYKPEDRLKNYHNRGIVFSTKFRMPWELVYFEIYNNKNTAFKREHYLKRPRGYQDKLNIINLIINTSKNNLPISLKKG